MSSQNFEFTDYRTDETYRVAVMGEFRYGKSSLINALLGADVLPTNVDPMTVTWNRIVYGNEKGIEIIYKDGSRERRPLEDLPLYGTKLDVESKVNASRIYEIIVTYPSDFNINRFEIIDTPGLFVDERNMKRTLGVLDEADVVIVVISAQCPYSMTEKDLVLRMIRKKNIHHIIFVVTHIDLIGIGRDGKRKSREEIQVLLDRFIKDSKRRITEGTLKSAEERFWDDPEILDKARAILNPPLIFLVSSKQAMEAFAKDDQELLEISGFPQLKHDIRDILVRGQNEMRERKQLGKMNSQNSEFTYYRMLVDMEKIAERYSALTELCQQIRRAEAFLTDRTYRVAVIGEFKRGKSSLINALLGADVLPTDVAPTTGTRSRIVYGNEKGIEIIYKDGSRERRPLEDLRLYGTKLDAESAANARRIHEIIVTYPSIFSQNRFEIIDTPGLNDDEEMTDTTLGVLDELDAAIVVISAQYPYSMTEKDLVLRLIGKKDIRHITFVVTFIDDLVSERDMQRKSREEIQELQDKQIEYIKQRITGETLKLAEEWFQDDPKLLDKARRILNSPLVFPVSSRQAMDAFVKDDWDLLELSRFPQFKHDIQEILTRGQNEAVVWRTRDLAESLYTALQEYDPRVAEKRFQKKKQEIEEFMERKGEMLEAMLAKTDQDVYDSSGLSAANLKKQIRKCFIDNISQIETGMDFSANMILETVISGPEGNEVTVRTVDKPGTVHILHATAVSRQMMLNCQKAANIVSKFHITESAFLKQRGLSWVSRYLQPEEVVLEEIMEWHAKNQPPVFRWGIDMSSQMIGQLPQMMDVMPWVMPKINRAVDTWMSALEEYCASWRVLLLKLNAKDLGGKDAAEAELRRGTLIDAAAYERDIAEMRVMVKEFYRTGENHG